MHKPTATNITALSSTLNQQLYRTSAKQQSRYKHVLHTGVLFNTIGAVRVIYSQSYHPCKTVRASCSLLM